MTDHIDRIRICLFGGGRGTNSIVKSLIKYEAIEVSVVINAYDDGLSTGRLREFVQGMLGPSDVRKNLTNVLKEGKFEERILAEILEYRIQDGFSEYQLNGMLTNFIESTLFEEFPQWGKASYSSIKFINKYLEIFYDYYIENKANYDLVDTALGNLVFAGLFIQNRSFNESVKIMNQEFTKRIKVLNATNGDNLFLSALTNKMRWIPEEASVVNLNSTSESILDIYLNKLSLKKNNFEKIKGDVNKILEVRSEIPKINTELKKVILESDLIIYGPGTPFSSLFPTYLTEGIAEALTSTSAVKIFIGNAERDSDSLALGLTDLLRKFKYFLNSRDTLEYSLDQFIDILLIDMIPEIEQTAIRNFLEKNGDSFDLRIRKWTGDSGKHLGDKILNEISLILNRINMEKTLKNVTKVSIIIPVLDEVDTIEEAINKVFSIDWLGHNLTIEAIVIDGGSKDGTFELLEQNKFIRLFQLENNSGRGAAIIRGINESRGDLVCTFHADLEYIIEDVVKLVKTIESGTADIVFGSRNINKSKKTDHLKNIYKKKYFMYLLSRYGGKLLMLISGLLYDKWISDPLTGIKIFRKSDLHNFVLNQYSLALETEFIVQAYKNDLSIVEVPVGYQPRTWSDGKKSTTLDGIKSIFTLIWGGIKN